MDANSLVNYNYETNIDKKAAGFTTDLIDSKRIKSDKAEINLISSKDGELALRGYNNIINMYGNQLVNVGVINGISLEALNAGIGLNNPYYYTINSGTPLLTTDDTSTDCLRITVENNTMYSNFIRINYFTQNGTAGSISFNLLIKNLNNILTYTGPFNIINSAAGNSNTVDYSLAISSNTLIIKVIGLINTHINWFITDSLSKLGKPL